MFLQFMYEFILDYFYDLCLGYAICYYSISFYVNVIE